MTVIFSCENCGGTGGVPSAYGTETCHVCKGEGHLVNGPFTPPQVYPRKRQGQASWIQLELPL